MSDKNESHSYLSCAAVARRLGLSRQRFWQLRKEGVFPAPQIDEATGRPFYTVDQLEICLDLRKRNVGLNGKVVLFYSARTASPVPRSKANRNKPKSKVTSRHAAIIDSLKALGMPAVNDAQVEGAIVELFPNGKEGFDQGELVRAVFLHLQRKNSSDNVG